jgi:SAM-dependent methyltransferase
VSSIRAFNPVAWYDAHAARYDSIEHGSPGDVAFYTRLALTAAPPVLELGCGTGRVTIEIARAGVAVTGLDLSAQMLAVAEQKSAGIPNINWVHADMRRFALPARFGLICVPFRSLQHLLTDDDLRAALECCRLHLRPDGILAFNLMNPPEQLAAAARHPSTGPRISRLERERPLRLLRPKEVRTLLEGVRFRDIRAFGGFDESPLRGTSTEQVWTARA